MGAVVGDGGELGSSELDAGLDPTTFEEGEWFCLCVFEVLKKAILNLRGMAHAPFLGTTFPI